MGRGGGGGRRGGGHIPTCMCCGTADHVKVFNGVELCTTCASKFTGGSEHGN